MVAIPTALRRLPPAKPTCKLLNRTIHGGRITRQQRSPPNPISHGTENYFIDSDNDNASPPNDPTYKIDAALDATQSAYESPSGPWSRAGAGTKEYHTVSDDEPYDVPSASGADVKLRYGGVKRYMEDKGPETSKAWEGPDGTERCGRKPEGKP